MGLIQRLVFFFTCAMAISNSPVHAQVGNCDSLTILDVELNPFDVSEIMVRSAYTDFDNFISYPGFSLVDEEGFIMAYETVNYFGLGIDQVHILDILNMDVEPGIAVTAELELWSFFYENLECTDPGPFVIWEEQECVPLSFSINALGQDSVSGIIEWSILAPDGLEIIGGTDSLTSAQQLTTHSICLPAGCGYNLEIVSSSLSGNGALYNLHYSSFLAVGAAGILDSANTSVVHEFNLYDCNTTGIAKAEAENAPIFPNPAQSAFFVPTEAGQNISVYNSSGQLVYAHRGQTSSDLETVNCADWTPGIYVVTQTDNHGKERSQRLVVGY